ncbi:MAG: DUF3536 domain-containing protein, partial [Firmicutes bacterium]|nr:DUF3536 domain-containing protein [Bacillota bacterium]
VKPAMVDLVKVGAHYAISSLFEPYEDRSRVYCYTVEREDHRTRMAGVARLAVGRARVTSDITRETVTLSYGVVTLGGHNVDGGVRVYRDEEAYREMAGSVIAAFERADFTEVIRLLDQYFEGVTYSLGELFRDKQREVLDVILESTLTEVASDYRRIYERHAALMRFLKNLGVPQPKALTCAAEFVLNSNLREAFAEDPMDLERINALLGEAAVINVALDGAGLGYALRKTLERLAGRLRERPGDRSLLEHLAAVIDLVRALPFEVDLWQVQNVYYCLVQHVYREQLQKAAAGDPEARAWVEKFEALGDGLRIRRAR